MFKYIKDANMMGAFKGFFPSRPGVILTALLLALVLIVSGAAAADGRRVPLSYDGFGVIDQIEPERLIINDSIKRLSSRVTFHDEQGRYVARTLFTAGTQVGYQMNKEGEVIRVYLFDGQLP
ncbi:hypothetical protein MJO47_09755 [Desulfuromonas sp. KJ2020]|uniref:hypothetical protein n=1 Tax=Desulfuromonas sp. KJ2020 TaxID=2919173 RepID=UPI0020A821D6|nr:hypothetical protein [Desulfuromonas sp. KJ2020]MCP3177384.1 hypothetical protein [Desulfuromonas sp. KJ2020]